MERFFAPVQTGIRAHPTSRAMGSGSLSAEGKKQNVVEFVIFLIIVISVGLAFCFRVVFLKHIF